MGRPQMRWSTLGVSDFIRVPSPAARIIALRVLMVCVVRLLVVVGIPGKAGERGFEPGRRAPKALVLPLHYSPLCGVTVEAIAPAWGMVRITSMRGVSCVRLPRGTARASGKRRAISRACAVSRQRPKTDGPLPDTRTPRQP